MVAWGQPRSCLYLACLFEAEQDTLEMRLGELRALRAENIDLARKRIRITAGWDQYEGEVDPKTERESARPS